MPLFRMLENPELLEMQIFLLVVVVIVAIIWRAARRRADRRAAGRAAEQASDEDALLARLTEQVDRMEKRMENLETILGDKDRPK